MNGIIKFTLEPAIGSLNMHYIKVQTNNSLLDNLICSPSERMGMMKNLYHEIHWSRHDDI